MEKPSVQTEEPSVLTAKANRLTLSPLRNQYKGFPYMRKPADLMENQVCFIKLIFQWE